MSFYRVFALCTGAIVGSLCLAEEPLPNVVSVWSYDPAVLRPFWDNPIADGESVLFLRDPQTGEATAQLLFPVENVLRVTRAVDWHLPNSPAFEEGRDFLVTPGSREIRLPKGSRIPSFTSAELRRPAGSQKYRLTHRDGSGEILFGAGSEYHEMQVAITYRHPAETWPGPLPGFDPKALPRSIQKLQQKIPLSIVLLGDSISTGCNASGWAGCSPWQPPYQDLLLQHLQLSSGSHVQLTNLAVGGTSTPWGVTRIPDVLEAEPDLVILAFGMNDASGRPAAEFRDNIRAIINGIQTSRPETEFILVSTMLGNRDWVTLKHELFAEYAAALRDLAGSGIVVADMTAIWSEMLNRKADHDLTGNGVNHPNDFGHRIYAQVFAALLTPPESVSEPARKATISVRLWPNQAPNGDQSFEKSEAKITVHIPENSTGSAIVICPGGGYGGLVTGPEGHGIASWLNSHGIVGVVLEYRLPAGRPYVPLLDAQRAIRLVRANAKPWGINSEQVGIMGFSAGGHLASTATTHFDSGEPEAEDNVSRFSCRPDFAVLVYPVVTMGDQTHAGSRNNLLGSNPDPKLIELFSNERQVTPQTPPIFLTHAMDDVPVPCANSRQLYAALQQARVPAEYLELPSGGHGLNGYQGPMWDAWQKRSLEWLSAEGRIRMSAVPPTPPK